jgi:cell wall-associated NlpC family hydrolase
VIKITLFTKKVTGGDELPYEVDTQPIVDKYNKMFESGKSTLDLNKKVKDTEINNQALEIENKYKQLADTITTQRTEGKKAFYGERNLSDYEIAKETRAKNELAGARNWRGGELIDINLKQNQKRTNVLTDVNTKENTYNKQLDTNLATGTKEYNTQKTNITKARSSLLDEYNTNLENLRKTNEAQKNAEISQKIAELQQRDYQGKQNMANWQNQYQMNQNQIDTNYSIADRKYNTGTQQISSAVMKYKDTLSNYANKYGVGQYTDLLLAKIMQEAGGSPQALATDPMQSSESAGYGRGYFKNPEQSIAQGVKYFSEVLKKAGGDVLLALQSYNFGTGFIDYVKSNGGKMTQSLINSFSNMMANKMGWSNYGDKNYVQNVLKFYNGKSVGTSYSPSGNSSSKGVAAVQNAAQFIGGKYVWGGTNPYTGVDCSGLTQYVLKQQGINIPRVSQDQYKAGKAVSKNNLQPGDLVFFVTDGKTVSHVGIYEGNGNFVHAASTKRGIVRNNLNDSYYASTYVGAKRYT